MPSFFAFSRRCLLSLLLACAVSLPLAPGASAAGTYALSGRVVQVADGDTLTLLVGRQRQRVRLASIDAPETGHGRQQPGQPHGQASRQALADLVAGKTLTLRCYEQDRYGREICDVPLPDGQQASRLMVAAGMAWANRQGGGKYLRDARLTELERQARQQRLGLWRDAKPVPPWEWRWKCWQALETGQSTPIC
ncbi:MAG: thermonuclease family protein [Castellaniella sp.]|uniref:thermonuclease family protein n=1 Tax=Castellaniella sp. TaxID=1955812 RepID=UPI003C7182AA